MESNDLKDAFFSVPIHPTHHKYLKFTFDNLFQFTRMANGYGPAMKVFNKISKVPFGHLRSLGHSSVVYVDDSYFQGETYQACLDNISDIIKLLKALLFTQEKQVKSQTCNNITCRIWDFCSKNQLWVSAAHIPGTINIAAD